MSLETIKSKLAEMYGDLIVVQDGQVYTKMVEPMVFVDKEYGPWTTSPNNVVNKGCVHPKRKQKKREATNLEKYGVNNLFKDKTRVQEGMLRRHGVTHPSQSSELREKVENTCLERFGSKSSLGNEEVREKIRQTLVERYGTASFQTTPEVREKTLTTNLERYGVANPMQNSSIRAKAERTNLERYGGVAPIHSPEIHHKIKKTNLERYGCEAAAASAEVRDKIASTTEARYGVDNPFKAEEFQAKARTSIVDRYGVSSATKHPDVLKKLENTNLLRYGVKYIGEVTFKTKEMRERIRRTCEEKFGFQFAELPNGEMLGEYLRRFGRTDLNYTSCKHVLNRLGFDTLRAYVEGDSTFQNANSLEMATQQLLGIERCYKSLNRKRPDFQLNETTFLDVDGLFWHSEYVQKNNLYHWDKREFYEKLGYRLIQIRENEISTQPQIVRSMIQNESLKSTRVYARNTTLHSVQNSIAEIFLRKNHLQGVGPKCKYIGLSQDGVLLMLLGYRKYGRTQENALEISRMCTILDHSVVGGFSKLLKHLRTASTVIYSWCDLRYASGKGYEKVGFKKVKDTLGWSWTDFKNVYNRLRCRANMDERGLTEAEHAEELGWVKIYDAGQRLYRLVC